jgi:hypothetical protein
MGQSSVQSIANSHESVVLALENDRLLNCHFAQKGGGLQARTSLSVTGCDRDHQEMNTTTLLAAFNRAIAHEQTNL